MEVFLIRHPTPQIDPGVCYGQTDLILKLDNKNEISQILNKIPKDLNYIYTSPLKRCFELAELINKKQDNTPFLKQDILLKELYFGEWELQKWDLIDKKHLQIWSDDYINLSPPGGETYLQLYERAKKFWGKIIRLYMHHYKLKKDIKVVIVTHSGVIRALLSLILDLNLKNSFIFQIDYGSIIKLKINYSNNSVSYVIQNIN